MLEPHFHYSELVFSTKVSIFSPALILTCTAYFFCNEAWFSSCKLEVNQHKQIVAHSIHHTLSTTLSDSLSLMGSLNRQSANQLFIMFRFMLDFRGNVRYFPHVFMMYFLPKTVCSLSVRLCITVSFLLSVHIILYAFVLYYFTSNRSGFCDCEFATSSLAY